jgi:SAM-dependent methyltransferase
MTTLVANIPEASAMPTAVTVCPDCGSTAVIDRGVCRLPSFLKTLPAHERELVTSASIASLYLCSDCGLGFRSPEPDAASLQALYASMPAERWQYATHNEAWRIAGEWLRKTFTGGRIPRVLDVGAFDGAFLQTLPKIWERFAIEPSEAVRADLQRKGITVVADFLDEPSPNNAGQFDVVTMFDVFEHLPQAKSSLKHALTYLRPGGRLLVSTGNCQHWTWRLLGGDHWYCEPVQHLRFASPSYIHAAVPEDGARVVEAIPHSHQTSGWRDRVRQAYETCAFVAFRRAMWWSPFIKLVSLFPGWSYVRHKTTAPYTPALRDHLFFVIEKGQ